MSYNTTVKIEEISPSRITKDCDRIVLEEAAIAKTVWWLINYGQSCPITVRAFQWNKDWGGGPTRNFYVVSGHCDLAAMLRVREDHPEKFEEIEVIILPPNGPIELQLIIEKLNAPVAQ